MRETTSRDWHRWRKSVVTPPPLLTVLDRLSPLPGEMSRHDAEQQKGPDGIRHELVARIRQQIADGTYDTEEKWLLAEEALLRRVEGCV